VTIDNNTLPFALDASNLAPERRAISVKKSLVEEDGGKSALIQEEMG